MLRRQPLEGPTIKAALLVGFGLTFGIWVFAGYTFTRHVAAVEGRAEAINSRYKRSQELLSTVRARILLGSVYVRDALLDPDARTADEYRSRLQATYEAADAALQQYEPILDTSAERERVARLRGELGSYRSAMLEVLSTDSSRWRLEARTLLRQKVVPKRDVVIRLSEDVQALNRSAFLQEQHGVSQLLGRTEQRIWEVLGLALAASFAIAVLATFYAGRLEDRIRRQSATELQNTRDLQDLSAKLITAQEEERRAIARELHDEVGQVLTTIKVELAVAQRSIDGAGGPGHLLDDARAITEGAVHTVRDLSHLLHPSLLVDLGLPEAVDWYLNGFGKRHGIRVELLQDGMERRFPRDLEAAAYRIVQEAATNIAKHAHATTCRVHLRRAGNTVRVTIEDDGVGFDPSHPASGRSLGLLGIRERAHLLRGTMRLESAPGRGTRVSVELPVAAAVEAEPADGAPTPVLPLAACEIRHV